jgi:hypothetical protein
LSRDGSSFEEKCALHRLWAESELKLDSSDDERALQELMCTRSTDHILNSVDNNTSFPHEIIIEPTASFYPLQQQTVVNGSGNTTDHVQVEEDNSLFLSPKSATPDLEAIQNFRLFEAIEIRPTSCLDVTRMQGIKSGTCAPQVEDQSMALSDSPASKFDVPDGQPSKKFSSAAGFDAANQGPNRASVANGSHGPKPERAHFTLSDAGASGGHKIVVPDASGSCMEQDREQAFGSTIILTSNNVNTPADQGRLLMFKGETSPPGRTLSPATMDPELQQQGSELQEVLRMFKETTTSPLSSCILQTPKNKVVLLENIVVSEGGSSNQQRKSPRLNQRTVEESPL